MGGALEPEQTAEQAAAEAAAAEGALASSSPPEDALVVRGYGDSPQP